MISLADTLQFVPFRLVQGTLETPVAQLQLDSRKVSNGDAFIAIKGNEKDGHSFIPNAIEKGASVVICEDVPNEIPSHLTVVQLNETWRWLGRMASNFYGHPSTKMKVVAVTGTNGKTTTATLLYELFRKLGYHVGLFSTVVNKIDDKEIPTNLTTPDAITIHRLMAEMVAHGCTHVFMEASSHALVQGRLNDVRLEGGVFTNITHDHLDYHKTFDNYIRAKKLLFDGLDDQAFALVNADDKRATIMLQNCRAVKYTYALKSMADFHGKVISSSFDGLQMRIGEREVWFRLIGEFNAYNLLCIYATAVLLEEDRENILKKMSLLQPARGRFEQIVAPDKRRAIVDYAHTPDALQKVLETIGKIKQPQQRVITVVGCGGNRDMAKRPLMATIAAEMSDLAIFTSDNPRNEPPESIIAQMEQGLSDSLRKKTLSILDRRQAIRQAVTLAQPNDIILVAGKGHETYQEINGVRSYFDDKEELMQALNSN